MTSNETRLLVEAIVVTTAIILGGITSLWAYVRARQRTPDVIANFNRTVADRLNLTMSGMSHASEFITLAVENHWRVTEQPVEILYTEYSLSKGQPLLNGVNIVFDGFLRGRMHR